MHNLNLKFYIFTKNFINIMINKIYIFLHISIKLKKTKKIFFLLTRQYEMVLIRLIHLVMMRQFVGDYLMHIHSMIDAFW
jgi:hypothetical protein